MPTPLAKKNSHNVRKAQPVARTNKGEKLAAAVLGTTKSAGAKQAWLTGKKSELAKAKPGSRSTTGDGFQVYRGALGPVHLTREQIAEAVTSTKR